MSRLPDRTTWVLAGVAFLVVVAWTNLTGLGLGDAPLLYDDVALLRFVIAVLGAAIAWVLLSIMLSRGNALTWDWTWVALGGLAVWAVISGASSDAGLVWLGHSERLEGVATVVLYAVLFGAGLQVGRSQRAGRRIAAGLVAGATVVALHGLLQFARLDPTDYTVSGTAYFLGSAFASLGNPNFLAGVLVLALPIAVALALDTGRKAARIALWASVAVIVLALYATYSQAAWLAVVLEGALAVGLWVRYRRQHGAGATTAAGTRTPWHAIGLMLAIVGIGVAVIVAASAIAANRGLRLWGSGLPETIESRLWLVESTAGIVGDHPVTGIGPDNYLEGFRLHRPDGYAEVYGPTSTNNNAHMWLLQYAATLGIPGVLLLSAALALGLASGRPRLAGDDASGADLIASALWVASIGFIVQMVFNVAVLASTVPFWLLLGVACAPRARRLAVPRPAGIAAVALCAVLLAVAVPAAGVLLAADATFMSSRRAYHAANGGDRAVRLAEKASALNPLSVKYARAVAQSRSALVFDALEGGASEARVRELHGSASDAFDRVLRLSPNDYAAYAWSAALDAAAGTALGDDDMLASAKESATQAATLDRQHVEVEGLLAGDYSAYSVFSARAVPALP